MLAMECRKLGYEIEESFNFRGNVKGFEIAGVSAEIQERFSKRTLMMRLHDRKGISVIL